MSDCLIVLVFKIRKSTGAEHSPNQTKFIFSLIRRVLNGFVIQERCPGLTRQIFQKFRERMN